MSSVLAKAKQQYRQVLKMELGLLILVAVGLAFWQWQHALSFFLGGLCAYLPFGLFVYWVFFRKNTAVGSSMKPFYLGEGLKWLATIVMLIILLSLKAPLGLQLLSFFVGYFVLLMVNVVLPFWQYAQQR